MSSIYNDMTDSEMQVASFLKELGLRWVYEFPVFVYDEKDRPRVWTPDFYIPKLGMHIEVCGSEDFDYRYRERIYQKNDYYVVFLHIYKQPKKWKNFLIARIREIEESRHTKVMKVLDFTTQR